MKNTNPIFFLILCFSIFLTNDLFGQSAPVIEIKDSDGGTEKVISCTNAANSNNISLTASISGKLFETYTYKIQKGNFNKYNIEQPQNALQVTNVQNGKFFTKKNIGFEFCFFGNKYSELVIGSNGVVTFDTTYLGNIIFPNFTATNPSSTSLPTNAIFGALQTIEIDYTQGSDIYYSLIGTAPNRKLIVSYFNAKILNRTNQASCVDQRTTTQIVLHETTNIIEVLIDSKPLPCADLGYDNALVGIINDQGTTGFSPQPPDFAEYRNTGRWDATKESWQFVPNGIEVNPSEIVWKDQNDNIIGRGNTTTVATPKLTTFYKAVTTYNVCGNKFDVEGRYNFSFSPDYPTAKDITKVFCASTMVDLSTYNSEIIDTTTNVNLVNVKYFDSNGNPVTNPYFVTKNEVLTVRVENKNLTSCYRTSTITLKLFNDAIINKNVIVCNGQTTNFLLSKLNKQIINDPNFNDSIEYYLDASASSPVTNTDVTSGKQIWIKLANCSTVLGPITITISNGPTVNTPINISKTLCDTNYDGVEPFDFATELNHLITNNSTYNISYYNSLTEAQAGTNRTVNSIGKGGNVIYARVVNPSTGCYSIANITVNINFTEVKAQSDNVFYCYDGSTPVTFDFTNSKFTQRMNLDPASNPTITFHRSYTDASGIVPKNPITSFTTNIKLPTGGESEEIFYVRFENSGCYTVRQLSIFLVAIVVQNQKITICDGKADGTENVTLNNQFSDKIAYFTPLSIKYFSDAGYTNEITGTNLILTTGTSPKRVYIQLVSTRTPFINSSCNINSYVDFILSQPPVVKNPATSIVKTNVCDYNANGYELFDASSVNDEIFSGGNVTFQYFDSYDPNTNIFTNEIGRWVKVYDNVEKTIYIKITNNTTGCYSKSEVKVKFSLNPSVIKVNPTRLIQCSSSSAIQFDLSLGTPKIFLQSQNTINLSDIEIKYFKTYDSIAETVSNPINNPYITNRSSQTVYAQFSAKSNGCYSIAPITLFTYLEPLPNPVIQKVCQYEGFDMKTLKPENLLVGSSFDPNANYTVKFYLDIQKTQEIVITTLFYPKKNQKIYATITVTDSEDFRCSATSDITFEYIDNKVPIKKTEMTVPESDYDIPCDIGNDGVEPLSEVFFKKYETDFSNPTTLFEFYSTDPDSNYPATKYNGTLDKKTSIYNAVTKEFTLYALVSKAGYCPNKIDIKIKLREIPIFDIPTQYLCPEMGTNIVIDLDAIGVRNGGNNYKWILPSGKVIYSDKALYNATEIGKYKLFVTKNNGCTYEDSFDVKELDTPKITKVVFDGNTAIIYATGDPAKKIWYSIALEGASENTRVWGTSNVFNNLPPGVHSFRVQYAGEECSSYQKLGLVLDMRKNIITPNDDGYNDKWVIKRLDTFEGQNSQLKIFDRYNNTIYEQTSNMQLEWDGKQFGRPVPTSTYWYIMKLPDGREFTGYIVVKNRD